MSVQYPSTVLDQFDTNIALITTASTLSGSFKKSGYRHALDKEPDSAIDGTYYLEVTGIKPYQRFWGTGEHISVASVVLRVGYYRGGGNLGAGDRHGVLRKAADDGQRIADMLENPDNYSQTTTGIRAIRYLGCDRVVDMPRAEIWESRFEVEWRSDLFVAPTWTTDRLAAARLFDPNITTVLYSIEDFSGGGNGANPSVAGQWTTAGFVTAASAYSSTSGGYISVKTQAPATSVAGLEQTTTPASLIADPTAKSWYLVARLRNTLGTDAEVNLRFGLTNNTQQVHLVIQGSLSTSTYSIRMVGGLANTQTDVISTTPYDAAFHDVAIAYHHPTSTLYVYRNDDEVVLYTTAIGNLTALGSYPIVTARNGNTATARAIDIAHWALFGEGGS